MKALKKALAVVACAAITLTAIPATDAYAATALATYNFDSMDGMTDTGLGTAPSIVQDPERGNVLQFADGETSSYKTDTGNAKGPHLCEIELGTPSSLKIANPYENTDYTSMTISYWQKVTDAAAVDTGAGVIGWISAEYTDDHPDARAGANSQEEIGWYETGKYIYGFTAAKHMDIPMINFAGLYHNWYCYWNETYDFADSQWHHIIITTDSSHANTKVYIDGEDLMGYSDLGKRWNKGEKDAATKANTLEPTLMDIITREGTELFFGHTGSNPTSSGVYIDDVVFYDSIVTNAEAMSMYNDAKASSTTPDGSGSSGNGDATQNTGNTDTNSGDTGNTGNTGSTGNTNVTGSKTNTTNNANKGTGTTKSNLPQTGVMSTTALVGIGVAVIGVGAVLLKKKED